ncbi:cytochrome P450 [Dactylosporangium sp. CA-233914]|uniref:cytochrome P450 n=1 Tax=Dactylosporangium sp. CA-233914 TaxID=3239934 RepID=UPI003D9389B5
MELPPYPFPQPSALEPPPQWAQLRGECPVAHIRLASGDQALLLTRYADVKEVLSDPRFTRQLDAADAARVTENESGGVFGAARASDMMTGAGHQRWRRLVGGYFTAKRMAAMRPRIEAMAEGLLDAMLDQAAPADLVSSFAFPLPVWVICDLLGVPDADRDRFGHWADTMLSLNRYTQTEIDAAQAEFGRYMWAHVDRKRADPGEDLISDLITIADSDDGRLSQIELVGTAQGLLIAGHETTANMIAKMVAMLLADRSRWERLLAEPALVRTTVEEALRFDANPGFGMPRYLSEPVTVSGTELPAGTTVINSLAAANRDEDAFAVAADMDLSRTPNPHLAFGAGPHSCLGQALARTELQTALTVLLTRVPNLELAVPAEELPRREGLIVGGIERVLVRW